MALPRDYADELAIDMVESMQGKDIPHAPDSHVAAAECVRADRFAHALLFTGHMIDRPGRPRPRFPGWAEPRVRDALYAAIREIQWSSPGSTIGLAGAASGGDLLFHEVCEELGIPTCILLALPPEQFIENSVAPAGPAWIERFQRMMARRGPGWMLVMPERWGGQTQPERSVWERANAWMIDQSIKTAPERALLALWDGAAGDGPGGTKHFIELASHSGMRVLATINLSVLLQG